MPGKTAKLPMLYSVYKMVLQSLAYGKICILNSNDSRTIMRMVTDEDHGGLSKRDHIAKHLGARKIEFISTAVVGVIFAISFAHLEYYYIKDPALQISNGEVMVLDSNFDRSRETEPIIGNMYQYHLFPMLFIFVLISFAALWDDMAFKLLGRHKRVKAAFIGVANLISSDSPPQTSAKAWTVLRLVRCARGGSRWTPCGPSKKAVVPVTRR